MGITPFVEFVRVIEMSNDYLSFFRFLQQDGSEEEEGADEENKEEFF